MLVETHCLYCTSDPYKYFFPTTSLKVLVTTIDAWDTFKQGNCNTVGGDGGCRVGKV